MRSTWLVPDDHSGGILPVAAGCCRQAALAGDEATLLLALTPTAPPPDLGPGSLASLHAPPPYLDIPSRLIAWLEEAPQDALILNGCEQADEAIPYVPTSVRLVYVVHDTAERYFQAALRHEASLDAIVAVSEAVARRFRPRLRRPGKLTVIHNGCAFPAPMADVLAAERADDLLFLGGDNPNKGALDVLALWPRLRAGGFRGRLHWFGEVGDPLRERIQALQDSDRILLHGRRSRRTIFEAAARSRVLLMLSRVEPFGMVTVECMGMGCMPVAWDVPAGTREIVEPGEGVFAPLADYQALARAVLAALERQPRTFAAAAARVREVFSEVRMGAGYKALLEGLAAAPAAERPGAGRQPPLYRPPTRVFQRLPAGLRERLRATVGRSAQLGYALRDLRGL